MPKTKRSVFYGSIGSIISILFAAVLLFLLCQGINSAVKTSENEGIKITESAVKRAAVTCYALEGSYPESLEYLIKNYDLAINTDKYYVDYKVYGENLMPIIAVWERLSDG